MINYDLMLNTKRNVVSSVAEKRAMITESTLFSLLTQIKLDAGDERVNTGHKQHKICFAVMLI